MNVFFTPSRALSAQSHCRLMGTLFGKMLPNPFLLFIGQANHD